MPGIILATEDELSEAICEKLLNSSGHSFQVTQRLRKNGFGYLKSKFQNFNQLAQNVRPVLLLTDLDRANCLLEFRQAWIGKLNLSERLLFRIAVKEVEAWLMADQQSFADWLDISPTLIEKDTEVLNDPKQTLLNLVRKSKKRHIKETILPYTKSSALVGLGYNTELIHFTQKYWRPHIAEENSESLYRARQRIHQLAALLQD